MNYELATRLALLHRDELLRAAAVRRLLTRGRPHAASARARLRSGVRMVGLVASEFSTALVERRLKRAAVHEERRIERSTAPAERRVESNAALEPQTEANETFAQAQG